jgi:hypothetical protein
MIEVYCVSNESTFLFLHCFMVYRCKKNLNDPTNKSSIRNVNLSCFVVVDFDPLIS